MASALLKRVVIENYKIFSTKQEVCFSVDGALSNNDSKYFTLVGENGCGKSTFLALIGLASDFGGRVTTRICDSARESIVACEYVVEDWLDLSYVEHDTIVSIYPALQLWFLEGILKIPREVQQFLLEKHPELGENILTLVIGFKHTPNQDGGCNGNVDKFLYIKCAGKIIVLVQPLNGNARLAVVDGLEGYDLLYWSQSWASMVPTQCNFLRCSTDVSDAVQQLQTVGSRRKHPQSAVILALRNTLLPVESRDTIWNEVIELFHQITGDRKITVYHDPESDSIHLRQQFGGTLSTRDYLSEGFFHAFIMAFLVVSPLAKTVLLDEPTAGMHPLQIRRLQRILTKKSTEKNKVIVIATHSPDMVDTSRISWVYRFQRLDSGFTEIRRVTSVHNFRDLRFISSLEGRELFFTRKIIWVEGDTDRRFCDAILKLIDEGDEAVWNALLDPRDKPEPMAGTCRDPACERVMMMDMDEDGDSSSCSSTDEIDYGATAINPLDNLFANPAYERVYFRAKNLAGFRELVRNCSVLCLSGKKNIDKATRICKDLGIPYAVICDLDAVLPNSKKYSIMKQFMNCVGTWAISRIDRKLIVDAEQAPASACVNEPASKAQLKAFCHAQEVMEFYEAKERIFAWRVGNGEIEDLVRVSNPKFSKKWWADFTFDAFQDLIRDMLTPSTDCHYQGGVNPELLRCFYFILNFLRDLNGVGKGSKGF